ncbi:MAG: EAL domain-containing protein [Ectothiorhodospiraceae bacterium]|nr:EAL domain-containing protein [Chromatiales bacterium]MCP5153697.1 EAL domain-containing protein [Ectothiorhodospiraceae bacterium]
MIRIVVVDGHRERRAYALEQPVIRIGRHSSNDVVLREAYVSAHHALVLCDGARCTFRALVTTNGSRIRRDGKLVDVDTLPGSRLALEHGDELVFGDGSRGIHLRIEIPIPTGATARPEKPDQVEFGAAVDVTASGAIEQLSRGFDRDALLALHAHATGITGLEDEHALLAGFAGVVHGLFKDADRVTLYTATADAAQFQPTLSRDRAGEVEPQPLSRTLRDHVLERRQALSFTVADPGFDLSESLNSSGVRSGMCAPMWNGERVIGLVQVDRRGSLKRLFGRHDLEVLAVLTKQLVLAIENTRLQTGLRSTVAHLERMHSEMERLAFYDPLTGLSNRRLLRERLQQAVKAARRGGHRVGLLYMDLDQFKRINDSYGHEAGDALLRAVSSRLRTCVRELDTVSRIGGDEFALLLADVNGPAGTRTVAQKVLEALRQPIDLAAGSVVVTASIGATLAPDDGDDEQTLFRNADLAMYRAKKRGRDTLQFFTEGMNQEATLRLQLENELRAALTDHQFALHYQPILGVQSGDMVAVEALLRWRHPDRGLVMPEHFMGVAEDTGIIVGLGEWVVASACATAGIIHAAGLPDLRIAVNLSARQLLDRNISRHVEQVLRETGLDPGRLEFELTESVLLEEHGDAAAQLRHLKSLGVTLTLDDFGTGYSSLGYLKRLPVDKLKLDRSFVSHIPVDQSDVEIAAAIIAMAHKLKMAVVAEGVETPQQLAFLRDNGCDLAQGFMIGRPQSCADLMSAFRAGQIGGGSWGPEENERTQKFILSSSETRNEGSASDENAGPGRNAPATPSTVTSRPTR